MRYNYWVFVLVSFMGPFECSCNSLFGCLHVHLRNFSWTCCLALRAVNYPCKSSALRDSNELDRMFDLHYPDPNYHQSKRQQRVPRFLLFRRNNIVLFRDELFFNGRDKKFIDGADREKI